MPDRDAKALAKFCLGCFKKATLSCPVLPGCRLPLTPTLHSKPEGFHVPEAAWWCGSSPFLHGWVCRGGFLAGWESNRCSGQTALGPMGCERGESGFGAGEIMVTADGRELPLPWVLTTKPTQAACISIRPAMCSWFCYSPILWNSCETVPERASGGTSACKGSVHSKLSACSIHCTVLLEGKVKVMWPLLFSVSRSYCIQISFSSEILGFVWNTMVKKYQTCTCCLFLCFQVTVTSALP